jgi:hypothetical protein
METSSLLEEEPNSIELETMSGGSSGLSTEQEHSRDERASGPDEQIPVSDEQMRVPDEQVPDTGQ